MENLCISCKKEKIYVKKRGLCRKCYGHLEYLTKRQNVKYSKEMLFIKNFFTHTNWLYHPAIFRLDDCNYEPDFYDGERNIFIEVVGTHQAFHANFEKYKLFVKTYPLINFEIRDYLGKIKPLSKRPYIKQQDGAKNNS